MRKYEIDWIRNIAILLLFPYHTAVIFDGMGSFFIKYQTTHDIATFFVASMFFWYMPLLFFLAGASTYFAFEKRTTLEYIKERCIRLLLPLSVGILTVVPSQVYYALKWRGDSTGNIFEFYKRFLFTFTDFKGIDGTFTPAHLWFILFLFLICLMAIPLIKWINTKTGKSFLLKIKNRFFNFKGFFLMYGIFMLAEIVPRLGDKSLTQNLLLFMLGYICYSDEEFLDKIENKRLKCLLVGVFGTIISVSIYGISKIYLPSRLALIILVIISNAVVIPVIFSIVGYGRRYLVFDKKPLKLLNKYNFYIYILHQPILIAVAYYILPLDISWVIKVASIIAISLIVTVFVAWILRQLLSLIRKISKLFYRIKK